MVTKVPKYSYVRLSELKPGAVVNVYGVVLFFKQPRRTRGTGQTLWSRGWRGGWGSEWVWMGGVRGSDPPQGAPLLLATLTQEPLACSIISAVLLEVT